MGTRPSIRAKEEKENNIYLLLFFFIFSFLIKVVFGFIAGSKALLVSGIFAIFGIFVSIITLLRIYDFSMNPFRKNKMFSYGKLEFTVVTGVSLIIVVSTGTILYSVVHMIFYHALFPPALIAAWMAAVLGVANLLCVNLLKTKIPSIPEADIERIKFLLNKDFMLSIVVIFVIIIARSGFIVIDYIFAVLEAIFIVCYAVYFLHNSLKGLMDGTCDEDTVKTIRAYIKKADSSVKLQTLKVNPVGKILEIIAIVNFSKRTKISEVNTLVNKIKFAINENLTIPHEVHVGFTSKSKKKD